MARNDREGGLPLDPRRQAERRDARDFDAEMEAHLGHRIDDLVAEGLSAEEARRTAESEFGDVARIRRESSAERAASRSRAAPGHASRWERTRQDLGFALRHLRHQPGLTLVALLTLTLGVGSMVTIASVVDAVVFDPLPFEDPDRVVFLEMRTPEAERFSVAEAVLPRWRERTQSFAEMAAYHGMSGIQRAPGQPRPVQVGIVTHSFLEVLGLEPALGRGFRPDEDLPGQPAPVAMLDHGVWQSDFAGDPGVIGSRIDLDGRTLEVIGVMPEAIDVLRAPADLYVPLGPDPAMDPEEHYLSVVARLAPGVSLSAAHDELDRVQLELSRTLNADLGWSTAVIGARAELIGETIETAGRVLLVAAGVLLLMACVNVSNLLMVRATTRGTELAVRTALGATRGRLTRQLFTESTVLAIGGGLVGTLAATLALPAVKVMGAARIPRLDSAQLDGTALAIGVVAVAFVALACGLAPVFQVRGRGLPNALSGARGGGADHGRRLRSALVTAQVALTVVLLAGTGLLLRSFVELTRVDPGFEPEGTIAFTLRMADGSYSWEERGELFPMLRDAVVSVPGVVAAGATAVDPFSGSALANRVAPEDAIPDRAADFTPIHWRVVTPGFFEAMGMEVIEGRGFEDSDTWGEAMPIVIGVSLAERLWGGRDVIGRRMVWGDPDGSQMTVVGVVEDLRDVELGEEPSPIVYRSHRSIPWAVMTMVVRAEGDPAALVGGIRARLAEVAPGLPPGEFRSLEENLAWAVAEPRFNLQLLSGFAIIGLLMAVVGVYGLTAFDVRRRLPEIGIRLSLGAEPSEIQRMIVRQRMVRTLVGLAVGLALAWVLAGAVQALLYGVTPRDPVTWIGVTLVIAGSALAATLLPARRAARVDPVEVLTPGR